MNCTSSQMGPALNVQQLRKKKRTRWMMFFWHVVFDGGSGLGNKKTNEKPSIKKFVVYTDGDCQKKIKGFLIKLTRI